MTKNHRFYTFFSKNAQEVNLGKKKKPNFADIMDTLERVHRFIQEHQLLEDGETVLLGLSGGSDSTALFLMLQEMGFQVICAHCNFGLRDEESHRDEAFVQQLCQRHGCELFVEHFDTRHWAQEHHQSIEMAARELRYVFFNKLAKEKGLRSICVAHHRDDNVETMLLNLVRGTGIRGLCGMQPRNGLVVRPLLCLSHKEILNYLEKKGQDYVTDSTNLLDDVARNQIRLDVLPLLQRINPAAVENMTRTMDNLLEVRKMFDYCVEEFCSAALDGPSELDCATILRAPSPLSVLHELLSPLGFNRSQIVDILHAFHSTGRSFTSSTHRVIINRNQLVIEAKSAMSEPQNLDMTPEIVPYSTDFHFDPSPSIAYFDADLLESKNIHIRPVCQGDRFHPFGMKGSKLVSDLLTDLKLSVAEKERQLLLCADETILWVIGCRSSEDYKVTEKTKRVMVFKQPY